MTLRPVRQGEPITVPVKDGIGFIRTKAPVDGFAWDEGDTCGFVTEDAVAIAMGDLKTEQSKGRKRRR